MNEPKLRFKADDGSQFPDWEEKKLGDDVQFLNGRAYKQDELLKSGKYLVLRVGNLFTNDSYYYSDLELDDDKYIENGNLIYAWSATFGPRIYHGKKCIYHYHIWKLKFDENAISKMFLNYCLLHDVENVKSQRTGGTMVHITKNAMENRKLYFPCFAEQQKIAEFLSTIDTVIEKQKEAVSAWEERKKGVMQKLFSQEVRFKADDGNEFPEWEEKKLGEVGDIMTGNTPSTKQEDYYGGCYLWVTPTDITDSREVSVTAKKLTELGYTVARHIPANSVLVTCIASIGKNAIIRENGSCNQQINSITPYNDYSVEFVYYLICQNERLLHANAGAGGMEILNKDSFSKIKMYFPCLAEQQKIADCLSSLDEVIEKQKATLAAWEELKKGLLQQMFV